MSDSYTATPIIGSIGVSHGRRSSIRMVSVKPASACVDSDTCEIDVPQMIFVIKARRLKPHDVHERAAPISGHLLDLRCFTLRFRH